MPTIFFYKGIDQTNDIVEGSILADSKENAIALLQEQNIVPVSIDKSVRSGSAKLEFTFDFRKLLPCSSRSVTNFYQQLELLLSSGVPLSEALHSCIENSKHCIKHILEDISKQVLAGKRLSQAMQGHSVFKKFDIGLIQAGEQSGDFQGVLNRLVEYRENKSELSQTLVTSMIYPVLMVLLTVGIIAYLVTKIIPKFEAFLEAKSLELPAGAGRLITISNFLKENGFLIFAVAAVLIVVIIILSKTKTLGRYIGAIFLCLPIVGKVQQLNIWINFCWVFSTFLKSGQPLSTSIDLIGESISNKSIKYKLGKVSDSIVNDGISFSQAMRDQKFNKLMIDAVNIGEQSGTIEITLDKLGKYYTLQLKKRLKLITSLFEPVLILVIGSIVGYIYYSFFALLFTVSSS